MTGTPGLAAAQRPGRRGSQHAGPVTVYKDAAGEKPAIITIEFIRSPGT
jgi:hypothetical protein